MDAPKSVGIIGAGRMGVPIIGHLVRTGFRTVATDVNPERRALVEARGGEWSTDTAALVRECDAILICVGFDHEVDALFAAPGPMAAARFETVVAILSTIHPKTVQHLAHASRRLGIHVIDATVCRGGEAADEGTLLSFVGGAPEVVERVAPILRAYSSEVVHTGDVGSAQVAKAVNNLILWACLVADHEGLALAQRYGVDVEALRRALCISSAANDALKKWGTQTMAWAEDDLAIIADMAADCGLSLPQGAVTREVCRALKARRYKLEEYGR